MSTSILQQLDSETVILHCNGKLGSRSETQHLAIWYGQDFFIKITAKGP